MPDGQEHHELISQALGVFEENFKSTVFLGTSVSLLSKGPEITVSHSQVKLQSWLASLLCQSGRGPGSFFPGVLTKEMTAQPGRGFVAIST